MMLYFGQGDTFSTTRIEDPQRSRTAIEGVENAAGGHLIGGVIPVLDEAMSQS